MINVTRQHVAAFLTALLMICGFNFTAVFSWIVFLTDIPFLLKFLVGGPIGAMATALFIGAAVMWRAGCFTVKRSTSSTAEGPVQADNRPWHLRRYPVA